MVLLMDLKHPLRTLVPSLDWAVLDVLASTQSSLGVTQIGRLSSAGSRMGHVAVLARLVEHGLVVAEIANHGSLYRFNREHILAPAVLLALGLRAELLERLADEAGQLVPAPVHASVFGSFARGQAGTDSDIDVLLLAQSDADAEAWEPRIEQFENRVRRWTGNRCRCLVFTVARARELARDGEPIVVNWMTDGVPLGGPPLAALLDARGRRSNVSRQRPSTPQATQ